MILGDTDKEIRQEGWADHAEPERRRRHNFLSKLDPLKSKRGTLIIALGHGRLGDSVG